MICVKSIQLYPSLIYVRKGEWNYDAYVEICPTNATNQSVYWHSADLGIASVNPSTGYIYGVSEGTTTIYASAQDGSGKKDCCTVIVTQNVPITSITLNHTALSLEVGNGTSLVASICPTNATNKSLTWCSSNTGVATVSGGFVCAKSTGTARITACANDGSGRWAACDVTVSGDVLVYSVVVEPESKTMTVGETAYLSAAVYPVHATNQNLMWTSGDNSIATVNPNSGLVMAQSAGTTNIYATAQDGSGKSDSCSITVNAPIAVNSVSINKENFTMNVGQTQYLTATVCPTDATDRRVRWCSSDSTIACVDYYTGVVCAKSPGTVNITATSVNGEKTDSITVTVIIDTVTIEKDGDFNRVIFHSTGKVWRCLNHDMIYTDRTQGDPEERVLNEALLIRSNYNFFTYFEEGTQTPDTTPKEYTEDEIKLLYAIDPYGVAHYIKRFASDQFSELKDILDYKDNKFRLLFRREPKYFARTLDGEWYEIQDRDNYFLSEVLSESEAYFGMHLIYDTLTLLMAINFAIDLVGLVWGDKLFETISTIYQLSIAVLTTEEEDLKNEISSQLMDCEGRVISIVEDISGTSLDWANRFVAFGGLVDILESTLVENNFCKKILNYCIDDTQYGIYFKLQNGELVKLENINNAIN